VLGRRLLALSLLVGWVIWCDAGRADDDDDDIEGI
jgi:hypothetical protein